MSFDLSTITSESVVRPPRIILLGVEKIGKSTFASQADRPFFLPIHGEEGVDDIQVPKLDSPVNSYNELVGWLEATYRQEHNFGTLVIDSSTTLEPLLHRQVCADNGETSIEKVMGGYGKGYTETLKYWRMVTDWLDALRRDRNMASIIIGHVAIKRIDDPIAGSFDSFIWALNTKAATQLYAWADVILFANSKVVVKTEESGFGKSVKRGTDVTGGRYLYTQKKPSHPGGGRGPYGRIPYEIPLNWQAFVQNVADASQLKG